MSDLERFREQVDDLIVFDAEQYIDSLFEG